MLPIGQLTPILNLRSTLRVDQFRNLKLTTRRGHKLWAKAADAMDKFSTGKHNANPLLNMLLHLQLLYAQRGKELGVSWRVKSSSKQLDGHS